MVATWFVIALQVLLTAVFTLDPYEPGLVSVPELWAIKRKWQFYLLIAAVLGSGVLWVIAWRTRAPVRLTLIVPWALFGFVMIGYHADRIATMAKLIWRHG